jgi:protein-S-isoprenylcysteine O-methyltransferase Ste14
MAGLALVLYGMYAGVAFGLRSLLQWRHTGDTGFRGISGRPLSPEWWAGVLFVLALLAGVLGPVLDLVGLEPVAALDNATTAVVGALLAALGIAGTLFAQLHMGTAWRIGVDDAERTELVTDGLFGWARNPIFTAMIATAAGLMMMAPNLVALLGLAGLAVAIYLQVAVVEEPYLRRVHGEDYERYVDRTGRFLPRLRSREAGERAWAER